MTIRIPVPPREAAALERQLTRLAHLRTLVAEQIKADLDRVDRRLAVLDALTPAPELKADYAICQASGAGNGMMGVSSDFEAPLYAAAWLNRISAHYPSDNSPHHLDREHGEADNEPILKSPRRHG